MPKKDTTTQQYAERLIKPTKNWKQKLDIQKPYRWNINRLRPGKTLDIGTGVGRILKDLPKGSVGVDHNEYSINEAKKQGMTAFVSTDFYKSKYAKKGTYDSLLLTHVLEHMDEKDNIKVLKEYIPFLKPEGKIIIACPQEKGFKTDYTHVHLYDFKEISELLVKVGFNVTKQYSFPFPRVFGKLFTYNEFIVVAVRNK